MSSILPIQKPTVGRIVNVTLSAELAAAINRDPGIRGNACVAGEVYPLIIARVWGEDTYADGFTINGQLVLDGVGTYWMTSVHHGDEPGQWRWPVHSPPAPAPAPLKNASGVDSIRRLDAELSAPYADIASPEVRSALNASGDIAADIALPKVRAAIQAEAAPAVLHERIAQLTAEVQELNALLIDRTAEAAQLAARAKRAEEERDRKRAAENELIRDRDRLIHKDIADLRGELENERAARAIYSDRLNKSDAELKASQDRERRLTERLANIAGIVSDI